MRSYFAPMNPSAPSGVLIVAVLGVLGATCGAQTSRQIGRPTSIDLNGGWRDRGGHAVTIAQSPSQVTLTTAAGRVFTGKPNGALLELRHSLTPEETDSNLPVQVRELCTGEIVTIKAVASADGNEIQGQYIGRKARWEKKGDEYTILGWDDVPSDVLFNRNGYYIAEISIDYNGWDQAHRELQTAVTGAQDTIKIKQAAFDEVSRALEAERAKMRQLSADLDRKRAALRVALAKAAVTDPAPSKKSAEYKNIEQHIAMLDARQAKLDDLFDKIHKGEVRGDPPAISKLFEEYDRNKTTLAGLQVRLQKLRDQGGFTGQLAALRQAAQQADDEYFDAYKADTHARSDFETAEKAAVRAQQGLDDAYNDYYIAMGALTRFDTQGSPRILGVRVGSYYDVTYWTPAETLRDLDKSIAVAQKRLTELEDQRTEDRATLDEAGKKALAAGQLLSSKEGVMGGSAISQVLIETGFYAVDIAKAWKDAGPAGALFEGIKKGVEGIVLGTPQFADPEISDEDVDAVFEHARDTIDTKVMKHTAKHAAFEAVTEYPVKNRAAAFLAAMEEEKLSITGDEIAEVLRRGGTVEAALLRRYEVQRVYRNEALEKFEEAVKEGKFRKLGVNLVTGFVVAAAKELLKDKMKQSVADFFMKDAFRDYLESDLECRGAALLLLKDSARYYDARDTYAFLMQLRTEIERQYDPKTHMKVNRNQTFYAQAGLPITLNCLGDAADHTATVMLGGTTATTGAAGLQFTVNAYELATSSDGGLKLYVHVTQ